MEAECDQDGEKLGPLGQQIVAQTIFEILVKDINSIFYAKERNGKDDWIPKYFSDDTPMDVQNRKEKKQCYTMIDLLKYTGIYDEYGAIPRKEKERLRAAKKKK